MQTARLQTTAVETAIDMSQTPRVASHQEISPALFEILDFPI
jgi:hypothetical protein